MERTGRLVRPIGQEVHVGNEQIRTLWTDSESESSPIVRRKLRNKFQTNDNDRRSGRKLGGIVDSQQKELHSAQVEELQRRDQQLLREQ